ncbi:hypothetical protein HZS_3702 [Henneguya salminicola]|nr:hypothetical protein HZS_3702 [Henneguya salminicola]
MHFLNTCSIWKGIKNSTAYNMIKRYTNIRTIKKHNTNNRNEYEKDAFCVKHFNNTLKTIKPILVVRFKKSENYLEKNSHCKSRIIFQNK